MRLGSILLILIIGFFFATCGDEEPTIIDVSSEWNRSNLNPVFRDLIPEENYEVASDPHVFYDENGSLKMIYSGDMDGHTSIKLANGTSPSNWEKDQALLYEVGSSGRDIHKETAFYRKSSSGKHQIYYIGYSNVETYQSEVYMAEADQLTGPYTQMELPVVPRGTLANKDVYLITSPSIVEHEDKLFMCFLGWNDSPGEVTEIWVIGATSTDDGHSWTDFQIVDTRIGAEGQVTKVKENEFVAVRTSTYQDKEAIFYATASHPFGPWNEQSEPILIQQNPVFEKDEVIAPQITIDPDTGEEYLYYTGADHQAGWWIMLATKK
ncbi:hypothetical protein AAOE16_03215 [Ekhidna sp. MALMAid0563]|uniref:hypothetical protein n=1 Tax=Ekhidna sp. MALMAid0563 TaxID=3143937 RepID=UPI0032DEF0E0